MTNENDYQLSPTPFLWREDFEAFAAAINGNRVTDDLYEVELGDSPRLMIGWCKGAQEFLSVELPSAL